MLLTAIARGFNWLKRSGVLCKRKFKKKFNERDGFILTFSCRINQANIFLSQESDRAYLNSFACLMVSAFINLWQWLIWQKGFDTLLSYKEWANSYIALL